MKAIRILIANVELKRLPLFDIHLKLFRHQGLMGQSSAKALDWFARFQHDLVVLVVMIPDSMTPHGDPGAAASPECEQKNTIANSHACMRLFWQGLDGLA